MPKPGRSSTEAEEDYKRAQNLQERGLGSQRDLDRARAARDSANARVASAESAVAAAQQRLDYTTVKAPYAGIVTKRYVELGETVTPGQPLLSGLSLERLRVAVDLPQTVAGEVRKNPQAAVITAEGRVEPGSHHPVPGCRPGHQYLPGSARPAGRPVRAVSGHVRQGRFRDR